MKLRGKVIALVMTLTLVLGLLAACGGGSDSSASAGADVEPNDGMRGIVFADPEGWKVSYAEKDQFSNYSKDGSDYILLVASTTEEDLKDMGDDEIASLTIQEYWDKYYKVDEKELKEKNIELSSIKVCDIDADLTKTNGKSGICGEAVSWIMDDTIYTVALSGVDIYNEDGTIKDDAKACSDQDLADFDYLVASIQKGDGSSLQKLEIEADSIGGFSFEKPEGFSINSAGDNYIYLKSDSSEANFDVMVTGEDELENHTLGNGEHPASVKELYEQGLYEGIETTKINGYDGYYDTYEEDGKTYYRSAHFLADDVLVEATINAAEEMWDDEGYIKKDAPGLTEEELAAFDAFVASLQKK